LIPSHLKYSDEKKVLIDSLPLSILKTRNDLLPRLYFQFWFDVGALGFGVMRRSLTNVSTVMNLLLIYISWIGWNGVTRLNPYKISLHGTFTMTIVVIFVLYLILITATGGADNEGPLLLLVFCTVSIDAFVGFQTLRFGFVLSR